MSEKRFEFREVNNCGITPKVWDNEKQEYANLLECVDWLNELAEENDRLKNSVKRQENLHEENEQLKQELKTKCIVYKQYEENQRLIKMLDNVANYMQKEHRDMPIDDFVEWWNNIATEGL